MDTPDRGRSPLLNTALILVITIAVVFVLVWGRDILIPIVIAGFIWYVINALTQSAAKVAIAGRRLPRWAATAVALVIVAAALVSAVELVAESVRSLEAAAPRYEQKLDHLLRSLAARAGAEGTPTTAQLMSQIRLEAAAGYLVSSAAPMVFDAIMIFFYVVFLLVQQKYMGKKLLLMFTDRHRHDLIVDMIDTIQKDIQKYFSIMVLLAILTGGITYAVLVLVGVDLAILWSVMIGLFSFIPTLGTAFGIAFPALIALLQFDSLTPFLIVLATLTPAQLILNNVLQPALMGRSLNLSPFVILVGLAVWGTIWGITGAILAVPIMVAAALICSHFPSTRPVAIFLSLDGEVR